MNRKTIFSIVLVISMIALTACASATATPTSSTIENAPTASNDLQATEPAATSSTDPNVTAPTADTPISMDPSLACSGGKTTASATLELTEGPYYTPGSPEQANLYQDGMPGTKLIVTGYVYDTNCQPVANAWLDFWQADATGEYDNSGYTLRGHQYTDANGFFTLTTVVPGIYPGRTEHIHFKVQAPNGKVITSQLFFPGVAQNESDGIFDESLLLPIQETSDGLQAQFNFVVPAQ